MNLLEKNCLQDERYEIKEKQEDVTCGTLQVNVLKMSLECNDPA